MSVFVCHCQSLLKELDRLLGWLFQPDNPHVKDRQAAEKNIVVGVEKKLHLIMWHLDVTKVLQILSLKETSHQLFGQKSAILGRGLQLLSGPVMCSQVLKMKS